MATKEVMVSAPLIVLIYDRTFVAGSFRESWNRRWGLFIALATTWLVLIGLVATTGWNRSGSSGFGLGITPWAYWITQFEAITCYLKLAFWPHPLTFEYGTYWVTSYSAEIGLAIAVVCVTVSAVALALWRWPAVGFLGAWFFLILAPTSIIPGTTQMIVEHRMYLPLAAVTTLFAIGLRVVFKRKSWVVFTVLALGLGLLTAQRNGDYGSELNIWSDTLAKRPNNARVHYNLGLALSRLPGCLPGAITQYEEALKLEPSLLEGHNNLGLALLQTQGPSDEAILQFREALRLKPDFAGAHSNLGAALSRLPGRLSDAIAEYEEAVRLAPDSVAVRNNLGIALSQTPGRFQDAVLQYEEALRLDPNCAYSWFNLGAILHKMGNLREAAAAYRHGLHFVPLNVSAKHSLETIIQQESAGR
jgi:Flp pilus assembly protein TadD